MVQKKSEGQSVIKKCQENPIKTSYELLWQSIKEKNPLSIQNTMRRIIEHYFKIYGNIKNENIVDKFFGEEQKICSSLISWVNDGSHGAHDDLYISCDEESMRKYMLVFEAIFRKLGHDAHYDMMMGTPPAASPVVLPVADFAEAPA